MGTRRPISANKPLKGRDRGLDLEDVLRRLDEEDIDTAFDEGFGLRVVVLRELAEGDGAQHRVVARRQHAGRSDRAGDEPWVIGRGVHIAGGSRQARGGDVQLVGVFTDAPFGEPARRRLKGARLDDIAAHREKRLVNAPDDIGALEHEVIVAAFEGISRRNPPR